MFSGLSQKDLSKEKWGLAKSYFKLNYCHDCHTRLAVFFSLPSCCVSSLMTKWQQGALGDFGPSGYVFKRELNLTIPDQLKQHIKDLEVMLHDDFQRNTAFQHCFEKLQHCSKIVTLCYAKNRRCESSPVTSPLDSRTRTTTKTRFDLNIFCVFLKNRHPEKLHCTFFFTRNVSSVTFVEGDWALSRVAKW